MLITYQIVAYTETWRLFVLHNRKYIHACYLHVYRINPNWRIRGEKPSCCPEWNIPILWPSGRHLKVFTDLTLLLQDIQLLLFALWNRQCVLCLFSWWPPVYCYGVLQWRRPAPEDPATENCAVLCWSCRSRFPATILTIFCNYFVLLFNLNILFPDLEVVCSNVCCSSAYPW